MSAMAWKQQSNLTAERFRHTCGVLKNKDETKLIVVAAGGVNMQKTTIDSVDILSVTQGISNALQFEQGWQEGQNLPMPLRDAASASTSGQKQLFLIGGTQDNNDISNFVLRLDCSEYIVMDDCSWTVMDYELKTPSTQGLALELPQAPMIQHGYKDARDCATNGNLASNDKLNSNGI